MKIVFDGVLTTDDNKQHVPLAFDLPDGITRLSGQFVATPKRAQGAEFDNLISLSVFGPKGSRGARHNNPVMDFSIDATGATPGYLPGAIEPGRWMVFLDTFRVLGPDPVHYTLTVTLETEPVAARTPYVPAAVGGRGRGWYRGDLHAHTLHSDGRWDVPDLAGWARSRGLDFMTLSDHNTVSGQAQLRSLAGDDLLVMGGMELTTHAGHALALGGGDWHEWRSGPATGKTMPMLAGEIMSSGALFVIAHPMSPGDPECTGCRWEFADMMPGPARIVEIWNGGPWSDYNEDGLALYRRWLSEGHRLVATAGSDNHGRGPGDGETGFNHVHAEELSEAAILAAIRAGRNYLSSGPRLILSATQSDGTEIPMGGETDASATARIAWSTGPQPLTLRLFGPEGEVLRTELAADTEAEIVHAGLPRGFVQAEVRDASGRLHAVTNPIFVR